MGAQPLLCAGLRAARVKVIISSIPYHPNYCVISVMCISLTSVAAGLVTPRGGPHWASGPRVGIHDTQQAECGRRISCMPGTRNAYNILVGKCRRKNFLRDLVVDGSITWDIIIEKQDVRL
jgi:hypothetical protein